MLFGAGPTGLILAQLLKLNGAHRVVIAANKGIKMDIAKQLNAADEYIELDRQNPGPQWEQLKKDNPYGFDVVVEATGVEKLAQDSINYVRRGGTIMIYGVYENKAQVHWPPSKIFGDEIRVCSFIVSLSTVRFAHSTSHRSSARSRRHSASPVRLPTSMAARSMSRAWYVYVASQLIGRVIYVFRQVTDVFKLDDYQKALDKMNSRGALKIAIQP